MRSGSLIILLLHKLARRRFYREGRCESPCAPMWKINPRGRRPLPANPNYGLTFPTPPIWPPSRKNWVNLSPFQSPTRWANEGGKGCFCQGGRMPNPLRVKGFQLVGAAGFEPTASSSRTKRATRLRYAPTLLVVPGKPGGESNRDFEPRCKWKFMMAALSGVADTARIYSGVRCASELPMPRRAGEGDHVADVGHAGEEHQQALEAEAEAGVRHGAVAAQVGIPPVILRVELVVLACSASSCSSRSSRWLPPMISPMPGTSTSMAVTVLPSSFRRM